MKILHVIDTLDLGGAERVCFTMLQLYSKTSHEVALLELKRLGPLTKKLPSSVRTFSFERKKRFHPVHLFRLSKVLKQYDVIHVQQRKPLKEVLAASFLFAGKYAIVLHDHFGNIKLNTKKERFISWFRNKFEYVGVNKELVSWAQNVLEMQPRRTALIPNIIVKSYDWMYNRPRQKEKLSMVLVSNFRPVKNIEFAIRLIAYLTQSGMNVSLTIFGQPVVKHYYEKMLALVAQLQMEKHISIVSNSDDVQQELNRFDLAIHTSRSEAHPLVLLEFSAYGLPFIAYNSCELTQEIGAELPVAHVNSFDFEDWKIKVTELLQNTQEASNHLRNYFQENYSSEKYMERWTLLYKSMYPQKMLR